MALLAGKLYDPAAAATVATSAAGLAMTAIDTTNLRLTFTAPPNGAVLVRLRGAVSGAVTSPAMLWGVIENSPSAGTLRGRMAPLVGRTGGAANQETACSVEYVVTGLTPGNSYTWDAAYGVETGVASSVIRIGGPNDTTVGNAGAGFAFEIWEATNLLAGVLYDPAAAVSKSAASLLAMTALDTTNLRLAFTTPASGPGSAFVLARVRAATHAAANVPVLHLGVLESTTVKMRSIGAGGINQIGTIAATDIGAFDAMGLIAVSPSTAYTWDAAYGVDLIQTSVQLKYGGPNDTTANNAFGGCAFEVWAA